MNVKMVRGSTICVVKESIIRYRAGNLDSIWCSQNRPFRSCGVGIFAPNHMLPASWNVNTGWSTILIELLQVFR